MEADRWDQLAVLFEQAQALPPGERMAFLDEACGDDADLRAQLDALLQSEAEAKAYFESLAGDVFASPEVEAAPTMIRPPRHVGHYEVLEKLGGGGMGVVYKGRDVDLDRVVALKFLPPHLNADEQAKERFIAEAKAASALDHTNICTIHEIGETDDGQLFIVMACYDGQTLKRKILQGPLSVEAALDYAVQIARGLEKAHAKGIVHRDVKPANVMVTADDVVKVLDFGLAKMADFQLTKTGTTIGTVAYMSPEQARGDKVDHQTDVWSLGVVLHEMLTGERPFKGDYDQAIIYSILHRDPSPLRERNPEVPEALEHVVGMCLEKDRDLRYATMADVLADLHVFVHGSGSNPSATVYAARRSVVTRRRRVVAGTAAGVFLLLMMALLVPASRQVLFSSIGLVSGPARTYIAVLPFASNLPDDQALADGLMQSVTSMIARLETDENSLWVVPAGEILQREITTAQEAQKIFGITKVLRGRLEHLAATTEVILDLEDPVQLRIIGSATLPGPSDPTFQERTLTALARLLDVGLDARTRQAATTNRPTTPDAYAFYLQGMGYLQRLDKEGNLDLAIQQFNQVLEEDPDFALAHAGLCEAAWEKYHRANDTQLAEEAFAHCDRAASLAEEQASVLVTLGNSYVRTGQFKKAETTLLRAQELEPDDAEIYRWLGRVYEELTQTEEAEKAYLQAIALKPNIWIYYNLLGILYYTSGRYEEAAAQYEQAQRLTPDNHQLYTALALARRNMNQVDEAKRLFQRSIALQPNVYAYRNLGSLYFREQQYDKAVGSYNNALALQDNDWIAWNWVGHAYYWAGDSTQARAAWQRAIDRALPVLEVNPRDDGVLCLLADAHIALGNREQGLIYLERLLAQPHSDVLVTYYIARMYAMLDRRDLALDWIERALENGFDPVVPDRDPWLKALREDPRYQGLRTLFREASQERFS